MRRTRPTSSPRIAGSAQPRRRARSSTLCEPEGVTGLTLLDVGGGIGAVQHELDRVGVSSATNVEASAASIDACRQEAERQGHGDRIVHVLGDFGSVAEDVPPSDIVTLDRSLCCWPDMPTLVGRSADKVQRWYGLVYPRDDWWVRFGWRVMSDLRMALRRQPMRVYVHRTRDVEWLLGEHGLIRHSRRAMGAWQVAVFKRETHGLGQLVGPPLSAKD